MARENHRFRRIRLSDLHFYYDCYAVILIDLALRMWPGGFGTPCARD